MNARDWTAATVAVADLMNSDQPSPGVSFLRALRQDPAFHGKLVAIGASPYDSGLFLNGLADQACVISPALPPEGMLAQILRFHAGSPLDALVPGSVAAARALSHIRDGLEAAGIAVPLPSPEALGRCQALAPRRKPRFPRLRIQTPAAKQPDKPKFEGDVFRVTLSRGAQYTITSTQQFNAFKKWQGDDAKTLWQTVPAGTAVQAAAVAGAGGKLAAVGAMDVISAAEDGTFWVGASFADPAVPRLMRQLVNAFNWRGPLTLDFVRTSGRDYALIRALPVLPSWLEACASRAGSMAGAIVAAALGAPWPRTITMAAGQLAAHYAHDIPVGMAQFAAFSQQLP